MNSIRRTAVQVLIIVGWTLFSTPASAGLVVTGTRFVLSAPADSLGISVENTGTADILVHSQVVREEHDRGRENRGGTSQDVKHTPFVVTPPLFVLSGGKSNQLRLTCLECRQEPADRESLFQLSVSAIPAGKAPPDSVQLAVRSHFKLFYRPAGLKGDPDKAYQQLTWRRMGNTVIVQNPTPYYVTLFKMTVNHRLQANPGMVPPYSTRSESWCPESGACEIQWKTLNDFGGESSFMRVSP